MPYIDPDDRAVLEPKPSAEATKAGELNFQISRLLNDYTIKHGLSYATMNDVVGVMEAAKLEYYRRVVVPYEMLKLAENGDVYEKTLTKGGVQ